MRHEVQEGLLLRVRARGQGQAGGQGARQGQGMGMQGMMEPLGQYGAEVPPGQAPEAISKAVASLPPEQMFELMKQMKTCIQNNPHDAREMLSQNPQLAYALLQAQVVMRLVDPELALTMLHKAKPQPPNFAAQQGMNVEAPPMMQGGGGNFGMGGPPPAIAAMGGGGGQQFPAGPGGPPPFNQGPAEPQRRDPREDRYGGGGGGRRDPRNRDPRASGSVDRGEGGGFGGGDPRRGGGAPSSSSGSGAGGLPGLPQHLANAPPEKTQLIMQVLKLTDDQIAMLPAEQRASIMELKKQIHQPPPQ